MYGTDYQYAASRLVDTVVMYGKCPVMVLDINRDCMVDIRPLDKGEIKKVPLHALNLTPVKLGYINLPRRYPVYICRVPKRNDWRQGMRKSNIKLFGDINIGDLNYKHIGNTIEGKYPSFEKAIAYSQRNIYKAWGRDWCITDEGIFNKARWVGTLSQNNLVELAEPFKYLQESLEESYANH